MISEFSGCELLLLKRLVIMVNDYALAVEKFGDKFYEQDSRKIVPSMKKPTRNHLMDIFSNGKKAHRFFFEPEDDGILSFEGITNYFGINKNLILNKLKSLNQKNAAKFSFHINHTVSKWPL